jgi:phosphoglycolate phosphatase-like HAD superfamily hydrolase
MLGPAPVVDFDGTVAKLEIAWADLRERAGVRRIDELWTIDRPDSWAPDSWAPDPWADVTHAETAAATAAAPVDAVVRHLADCHAVAVLTSNAEAAVEAFLDRFPDLAGRVVAIVGRETLAGPKSDFATFERGYRLCVEATADARGDGPVVYVGDMDYELDFAQRLGATAIAVSTLESR